VKHTQNSPHIPFAFPGILSHISQNLQKKTEIKKLFLAQKGICIREQKENKLITFGDVLMNGQQF
jgi:hypothetical protein